ncbi:CHRD domain-containing protein [Hymenobacter sp. HMF4947]|uniref:CHRD domain-containing protein n=1 Tax=Hymenobacter ginkgonis TaxID=2682976 RepID=A0A7K1T8W4_9BACT|nr:CHRD domain-containing protein [Hymenobacter ginkgonis]MVN74844.1 CHRD domain-containing protein [Hymenobacter ginkgonis]
MKKLLLVALAALTLTTACKKNDDSTPTPAVSTTMQVSSSLTGAQEIPAVTTSATGAMTGTYDTSTRVLTYAVTYAGLSSAPTGGHLHLGGPTVASGPVSIAFTNVATSPITGTVTLSTTQADALLASGGGMYVNLHTTANGNGEIRGNVVVK